MDNERELGMQWLVEDVDKIVLGDQHHADALKAMREARGKPWMLLVESEDEGKPVATLYASMPDSGDGHVIARMARCLHNIAERYYQIAASARADFMFRALTGQLERDDEDTPSA